MTREISKWVVIFAVAIPFHAISAAEVSPYTCSDNHGVDSSLFASLQKEARSIDEETCAALKIPMPESLPHDRLESFAVNAYDVVEQRFANARLDRLREQFIFFKVQVYGDRIRPESMPVFVVQRGAGPGSSSTYFFNGNQANAGVITTEVNENCKQYFEDHTCTEVLADLADAIEPYQINYNAYKANRTVAILGDMNTRWDAYFENGRSQTTLDLIASTYFERHHFQQDRLVGPPVRQWFLLHPDIVLEQVNGAPDGKQLKPGLAVELIGVNWWENSIVGVPIGASVAGLYSDRSDVNDTGLGITLHVDNRYSLGWSRHGGKNGYYVTWDLLKLFENKKDQIQKYRDLLDDVE